MQQYFVYTKVKENEIINLDEDTLYHLVKVLRKDSQYTFRVCDSLGHIYHAHLIDNKRCHIDEYLDENNELDVDITCVLSLIKNDKLELTIQKLVELGVKRIVPFEAQRSVVKIKENKKIDRLKKIVLEASEQSHRNFIPEICEPIDIRQLDKYKSRNNYICYETEKNIINIKCEESITYIIGPEGGFTDDEYKKICQLGFESVSLGKRILRAETAAIYMTSIIVSKCQ